MADPLVYTGEPPSEDELTLFNLRAELAEARAQTKDANELAYSVARHDMEVQLAEARAQIAAKDAALRDARDSLEAWAGYASDYFKDKHDYAGDLARIDAALTQEKGTD
jgi:hypothetical protein